jgi:hypothetical protein
MSEWNFVLPVIDPVKWIPEADPSKLNPIRRIEVRVTDRFVPWNRQEHGMDGHQITVEWRGPDDESDTYQMFITDDALNNGPWTYRKVPVGHGWRVWLSSDEVRKELGDPTFGLSPQAHKPGETPRYRGTLRVTVCNEVDGDMYHVRRDGSHPTEGRMVPVESARKMPTDQQIRELANAIRKTVEDEQQQIRDRLAQEINEVDGSPSTAIANAIMAKFNVTPKTKEAHDDQ